MDDIYLDAFFGENWDEIIPELARYAHLKVAFRRRHLGRMAIPTELDPDDYVQRAIKAVLTGTRRWNKEAYPTLLDFLESIVDSMLSNWGRSVAFRSQQASSNVESDHEIAHEEGISPEHYRVIENEFNRLLDGRDDGEELFAVLEGELDGKKRMEIAEEWGMTPEAVTNARKRLFRLIESDFNRDLLDNLD